MEKKIIGTACRPSSVKNTIMKQRIIVNDFMQKNYTYDITQPAGEEFHPEFSPELTPKQMLEMGVFGGKYMTDCRDEFPPEWFTHAKLCHERHDSKLNYFGVNASQPLSVWREKKWIYHEDPRGCPCRLHRMPVPSLHRSAQPSSHPRPQSFRRRSLPRRRPRPSATPTGP